MSICLIFLPIAFPLVTNSGLWNKDVISRSFGILFKKKVVNEDGLAIDRIGIHVVTILARFVLRKVYLSPSDANRFTARGPGRTDMVNYNLTR